MNTRRLALLVIGLVAGLAVGAGWRVARPESQRPAAPQDPGQQAARPHQPPSDPAHDDHGAEPKPAGEADDHSGHDHAQEPPAIRRSGTDDHDHSDDHGDDVAEPADAHAGHDHAADDGHDDHAALRLHLEDAKRLNIECAVAGPGVLGRELERPAEVILNDGRVAHITPRTPGVVREVLKNVGDPVQAGDVMAWIESAELGQAKADYLARLAEVGCCTIDLTRAREIHDNTLKLLEILESGPALESWQQPDDAPTGDYGRVLVSAYAELELARAAHEREHALLGKGVASEMDHHTAGGAYKKAAAEYAATRDSTRFEVRRSLLEAERTQRVRQIELKSAERRLHVLGLDAKEIKDLERLAQPPATSAAPNVCNDPDCKDCAGRQSAATPAPPDEDERLAWYALRAPFAGTVIEKHITLGERLDEDASPFTIADLSSVWVDINIYQSDLPHVVKGREVSIVSGPDAPGAAGTIAFVAPVMGRETRTTYARVVLPNADRRWIPGLYVVARLPADEHHAAVVIPKAAVQTVGDETVVFVPAGEGFESRPVSVGRSTATHAEIVAGLSPGDRYVHNGAFALKAELVTSGLDPHAGHGH